MMLYIRLTSLLVWTIVGREGLLEVGSSAPYLDNHVQSDMPLWLQSLSFKESPSEDHHVSIKTSR